jgi:hypothetical protein
VLFLEKFVERLGLRHGARKTVENEAVLHVRLIETIGNDPDHDFIRHQRAARHDVLGPKTNRGLGGNRRAQHFAGRKLHDAVSMHQPLSLCPLAGARWPQKNQSHLVSPPGSVGDSTAHLLFDILYQRAAQRQRRRPRNFDFLISPSYWWASRYP